MNFFERFSNFITSNPLQRAFSKALKTATDFILYNKSERDFDRFNKVLRAARIGDQDYLVRALEQERNIDYKKSPAMEMVMSVAVESGQSAIVELLLQRGVPAEGRDLQKRSHAEVALEKGHNAVIEALYKNVTASGNTPSEALTSAFTKAKLGKKDLMGSGARHKKIGEERSGNKPAP